MNQLKSKGHQILIGEGIVTLVTVVVTLAFIDSGFTEIVRNVIVVDVLFLVVYILWLKLFGNYEKMYKFGLKDE